MATLRDSLARARQRGVTLLIALIALIAMTLAGIAVMRSVDSNLVISGNLAFRQAATQSADRAIDQAFNWLVANAATLSNNNPGGGYYSSRIAPDWHSDTAWSGLSKVNIATADAAGNTAEYVIYRMCELANTAPLASGQQCILAVDTGSGGATPVPGSEIGSHNVIRQNIKGGATTTASAGGQMVAYRITARITGPRNTRTVVEAVAYMPI